jgi:PAS domain S-box-containing protein
MTSTKLSRNDAGRNTSNEQIFQKLFEMHSAIMLLIDPKTGIIMDANRSAVVFYGYPSSKLCGMSVQPQSVVGN